ncbi:MAG: trypsin-like peptidase domain-containing protein [Pseudomonadota bacterium]
MRIGTFCAFAFTVFSVFACKHVSQDPSSEKVIIGNDDFVAVNSDGSNIPEEYRSLIRATGYLDSGCTVTHIGNGLVLTAGHCLAPNEIFPNDPEQCLPGRSIQFGIFKDGITGPKATCIKRLYAQLNNTRDVALLHADKFPSEKVDVEIDSTPAPETQITLFGHPDGRPLQWSKYCSLIVLKYCNTKDAFGFLCDSLPGSSGSLLLSADKSRPLGIGVLVGPIREEDKNCASRITGNEASEKIKFFKKKYNNL